MRNKVFLLFLGAFLFRGVLAFLTWHPDVNNHIDWGIRFWEYGPRDFYKQNVWSYTWPDQPPGTMLIFAAIRKLHEAVFSFFWFLNITIPPFPSNLMFFLEDRLYPALLKLPAILADLGIAALIFQFFKKQKKPGFAFWGASIFLFNPVIWYNSSLWGQTDSTVNFFGLLALMLLLEKRLVLAFLSLFVSLFIKASLIVLLPVFLVVAWRQRNAVGVWIKASIATLVVIGILTLPFAQGELFSWLSALYQEKIFGHRLELITANAFNFWATLTGIHARPHDALLGPLTFRIWGFILFGVSLVPLLFLLWKKQDAKTIFLMTFLLLFASFILPTGVHERYLYPVFPILTILAAQSRRLFILLAVISGIHLLNLYNFWWYPQIDWLVNLLSAEDRLAPRILGGVMTVLFAWVYFLFLRKDRVT